MIKDKGKEIADKCGVVNVAAKYSFDKRTKENIILDHKEDWA